MKPIQMIRLEPEKELDGTRYAWKLVIQFDPDWQSFELKADGTPLTFSVHVPDDWVEGMKIPVVDETPLTNDS